MSTSKHIDRICIAVGLAAVVLAVIFCCGKYFGVETSAREMGYESRLFDTSRVHTVDIVMDGWDSFISTCESEEYSICSAVIDGEAFRNIGIRGKGNTSLSSVSAMGSSRYSFKIEFDCYDSSKSYHGLDKLCLNNIIQDNTYMKDYLAYTLMSKAGAAAPLCSYAYITVNGSDWGLYLAVEGVEEAFLQRNYGSDYGELYKPDSTGFGGGRGNGAAFDMENFAERVGDTENDQSGTLPSGIPDGTPPDGMPPADGDFTPPDGGFPDMRGSGGMDGGFGRPDFGGKGGFKDIDMGMDKGNNNGMDKGMGSDDVKLKYIDDNPSSYSNIFDNAKTDVTDSDKARLIASLKAISEQTDIESAADTDALLRYFAVHNFLCNGDSYTGDMVHNYYLYEKDGRLSMIPWDYNLAFGTFHGSEASSQVNAPIDSPVSGSEDDRPMVSWIFSDEKYRLRYHELLAEFINGTDFSALIDETAALISEYVEKDPTKFCTYEEFETGVSAIKEFCRLRAESVSGQLDGTIPSTSDGQKSDSSALVDASSLKLSDMGSMANGGGMRGGMQKNMFSGTQDGTQNNAPDGMQDGTQNNAPNGTPNGTQQDNNMPNGAPDGMQNRTQNGTQKNMPDNMQYGSRGSENSSASAGQGLTAALTAAVLGAGILFAVKFKGRI